MARRAFHPGLMATTAALLNALAGPAAAAGDALWTLQSAMQACIQTSQAKACPSQGFPPLQGGNQ